MTPRDEKSLKIYAMAAGGLRLIGQLCYSFIPIKGIWYKAECWSDIFFWLALFLVLCKFPKTYVWAKFFFACAVNDTVDQFLFDPQSFDLNEKMFFTCAIYWLWGQYNKNVYNKINAFFVSLIPFSILRKPLIELINKNKQK